MIKFKQLLELDNWNEREPLEISMNDYNDRIRSIIGSEISKVELEVLHEFLDNKPMSEAVLRKKFGYNVDDFEALNALKGVVEQEKSELEFQRMLRMAAVVNGYTYKELLSIPQSKINQAFEVINELQKPETIKTSYEFDGQKYTLPVNIEDPAFGRYHDFENYFNQNRKKHWHCVLKLVAVHSMPNGNTEYDPEVSKRLFEELKEMEVSKVYGWVSFFLKSGQRSLRVSRMLTVSKKYLDSKVLKRQLDGAGLRYSLKRPGETLRKLRNLLELRLYGLLQHLITKITKQQLITSLRNRQKEVDSEAYFQELIQETSQLLSKDS